MIKKWATLAAFVLLLSPAAARADWLFTPQIGTTFGNGGGGFSYGASVAWMGAGRFGWEFEVNSTPNLFDLESDATVNPLLASTNLDLIDDHGVSYMFNAIVGQPFGAKGGNGWRPYFSGGLGWIKADVQSDELLFDESRTDFAFDLGGGVMTYFHNVGIRGDIRYYQTLSDSNIDNALGIDIGDFNFWRASIGATFRW